MADIFVVEPLTDYIFLGAGKPFAQDEIVRLSQILFHVSRAFRQLNLFYRDLVLRSKPELHRLFPNPTPHAGMTIPKVTFTERFKYEGRDPDEYRRSLFLATYGDDNEEVIVKSCDKYHGAAHKVVVLENLGPELFFCERIGDGMFMVITKFIKGRDAHFRFNQENLPANILDDVKLAIKGLHDAGLVFGDLRRPNILITKQPGDDREHAVLVDFEWVGQDGQARYPALLNNSGEIKWPLGVQPHAIMKKDLLREIGQNQLIHDDHQ